MNLREGTRRLALVLGIVGAIGCGVLSCALLQSDLQQRADHQKFERLANSSAIQQARQSYLPPWQRRWKVPPKQGDVVTTRPSETPAVLNDGEIKVVHWTKNLKVSSIETQDGQILYSTPAPGIWSYLLVGILPLLGFLVPWGVVRSLGWVLAGFVQPSK